MSRIGRNPVLYSLKFWQQVLSLSALSLSLQNRTSRYIPDLMLLHQDRISHEELTGFSPTIIFAISITAQSSILSFVWLRMCAR